MDDSGDGGSSDRDGLPESIGPYRILALLGRGGMGEVFKGSDSNLARLVAIKRIRQDKLTPIQRERLLREAQSAANLSHPSIVGIYQMLKDADGNDCIVMEYVDGPTLAATLLKGDPWQPLAAVLLAREIASGLAAAHGGGIIHRDLKTENVMLTRSRHAKILDFGLAKPIEPTEGDTSLTQENCLVGTCRSMSPEQVRQEKLDGRSDLFSFGVLLYEILTCRSPFNGSPMETLNQVVFHHPPPVSTIKPEVPSRLSALVARLLEKDPACRPQSAEEVIQELEAIEAAAAPSLFPSSDQTISELPTGYYKPSFQPPSDHVSQAAALPETTGGMSVQKQGWQPRKTAVVVLCLVVLGSIAALVWPLIPSTPHAPVRPAIPSIRIVMREPELNDKDERLQHAAQGVSIASLSILNSLAGVTALEYEKFIGQPPTDQKIAQTEAADEILRATILKQAHAMVTITLRRIRGSDGQTLWQDTFSEPIGTEDLLQLSQDVSLRLVHSYHGHPPRPRAFLEAHKEDYETFLGVKLGMKTRMPSEADLSQLQGVMDKSPRLLEARLLAAEILLNLYQSSKDVGRLNRALALVQGAEELAPHDTRWLISRFKIELERDTPDVAAQILPRIEQLFPSGHPLILFLKAKLEEKEDHMDRALSYLRDAAALSPTLRNLNSLAELEGKTGHLEKARGLLDRLRQESPNNIWTLNRVAELELRYGDLNKAEQKYLNLTRDSPRQALFTNLGVTQVLLHHYRDATASFHRALKTDAEQVQVNLDLAEAELAMGQKHTAETLFRMVLEQIEKNKPPAGLSPLDNMVKAQCLAHLQRKQEAVEITLESLQQRPEDVDILLYAAQVYAIVGDASSAVTTAKKALQKGVASNWFHLPAFDSLRDNPDFTKLFDNPPGTLDSK